MPPSAGLPRVTAAFGAPAGCPGGTARTTPAPGPGRRPRRRARRRPVPGRAVRAAPAGAAAAASRSGSAPRPPPPRLRERRGGHWCPVDTRDRRAPCGQHVREFPRRPLRHRVQQRRVRPRPQEGALNAPAGRPPPEQHEPVQPGPCTRMASATVSDTVFATGSPRRNPPARPRNPSRSSVSVQPIPEHPPPAPYPHPIFPASPTRPEPRNTDPMDAGIAALLGGLGSSPPSAPPSSPAEPRPGRSSRNGAASTAATPTPPTSAPSTSATLPWTPSSPHCARTSRTSPTWTRRYAGSSTWPARSTAPWRSSSSRDRRRWSRPRSAYSGRGGLSAVMRRMVEDARGRFRSEGRGRGGRRRARTPPVRGGQGVSCGGP